MRSVMPKSKSTAKAIAAGFGELGKHGSMINRQYGSLFRLAYVMTDMPLMADSPDDFGADGFCTNCRVCTRACPVDAIHEEKQMVRGHKKWFVNFDKCVLYFNENNGCAICIAEADMLQPQTTEIYGANICGNLLIPPDGVDRILVKLRKNFPQFIKIVGR